MGIAALNPSYGLRHHRSDALGRDDDAATFEEATGGTGVTLLFTNLPTGLRVEDNEAGSRLSLEQLARRFGSRFRSFVDKRRVETRPT